MIIPIYAVDIAFRVCIVFKPPRPSSALKLFQAQRKTHNGWTHLRNALEHNSCLNALDKSDFMTSLIYNNKVKNVGKHGDCDSHSFTLH